jgi:hypothetical protein
VNHRRAADIFSFAFAVFRDNLRVCDETKNANKRERRSCRL